MARNSYLKLFMLGGLYLSQYLPISFLSQSLPTFMRQQGASLETIGSLGLLVLPWALKFLWSPLIDRVSLNRHRHRHYSTWILFFQILLAVCVTICGLMDVRQNFPILMGLTLLACFVSASQDIATDALAVGMLTGSERAWGSTMQSAGNYLGGLFGGGVMLILLDRLGWRSCMLMMTAIILATGIPLLKYQERELPHVEVKPDLTSLIKFFKRDGSIFWLMLLLLYSTGSGMAIAMMKPLLVDLKFTLVDIGQIVGIVSYSAGIVGAVIGGTIVSKWGVEKSLIMFSIFGGISVLACLPVARGVTDLPIVYAANISLQLFSSMGSIAISTVMLEKSELATAGTDYTIQTSFSFLGGILTMFLGGSLAEHFGYQGMLIIAAGMSGLDLVLIQKWRANERCLSAR
jgi:MFS transporter, PAT family, beta-lactamase induction signal transducer AmpG